EKRLARDERKAAAAWSRLDQRNKQLAAVKGGIEQKLEAARWKLQGQADASVAAGAGRGAGRLDQPETRYDNPRAAPVGADGAAGRAASGPPGDRPGRGPRPRPARGPAAARPGWTRRRPGTPTPGGPRWGPTSGPLRTAAAGRGGRTGTPDRTSPCRSARRCG